MHLRKDIRLIGIMLVFYNLSPTPFMGNTKKQHICYVLITLVAELRNITHFVFIDRKGAT
jgi:hypothetical protein